MATNILIFNQNQKQFHQIIVINILHEMCINYIIIQMDQQSQQTMRLSVQERSEETTIEKVEHHNTQQIYEYIHQYLLQTIPQKAYSAYQQSYPSQAYGQFCQTYNNIIFDNSTEQNIYEYANILVKNADDQSFFQHFTENKFLSVLMTKMRQCKYSSSIVKAVFASIQYLLKGLKKQLQYNYLLITISKYEFITQPYVFQDSEDWAYFANFLKLLVRSINQPTEKEENVLQSMQQVQQKQYNQGKYLSLFFNKKMPEFPLMLKLLKLHNFPDIILQTSIKLCFLQICKHPNKQLNRYLLNFPFVIFYPLYFSKVGKCMKKLLDEKVKENQQIYYEQLLQDLKFIEDFLTIREETSSINMYANVYHNYIGKLIYQELCKCLQSYKGDQKQCLRIFQIIQFILKMNTIVKVRVGFQNMFHKYINIHYLQYLKKKIVKLDNNYWLLDEIGDTVREHCASVFYSDGKSPSKKKSIIKTMNSYIPKSKSNWQFYELKRLSQIIGVQIIINEEINHYEFSTAYDDSYLCAIARIQTEKFNKSVITLKECEEQSLISKHNNPNKPHSLFNNILHTNNQQIIYRYIMLLYLLKSQSSENYHYHYKNQEEVCDLLFYAHTCTSLSLISALYNYIQMQSIQIDDTNVNYLPKQGRKENLLAIYISVMEKILHYIICQGWDTFLNRIMAIKDLTQQNLHQQADKDNKQKFYKDVFRDIDCDILYFIMLRHLFGTKNKECEGNIAQVKQYSDVVIKEIKVECRLSSNESKVYMVMNAQYVKFTTLDDVLISKKPLSVNCFNIYENDKVCELVDKELDGQSYTVMFEERSMREYIGKEIKMRKDFAMNIELTLRTLYFPIS